MEGQFINAAIESQNAFNEIAHAIKVVLKSDSEDNKLVGDVQSVLFYGQYYRSDNT
ncbi:hypothetical protein [Photobacterium leiognathi]|uniref:hypothetical protein n=1 Tax=Photobacterium leiognathi TaxID=553611 RepID=UPI0027383613|nr:hypothetical protein [Photobacterium leiognathi]